MSFKKGDKVKFLNDVGEGVIVRFQDKNIAIVHNNDGFEVPVLMNELLKIEEQYVFDDKQDREGDDKNHSSQAIKETIEPEDMDEDGLNTDHYASIFFAVVPEDKEDILNSDFKIFLINDSNFRVLYSISRKEGEFQSLMAYGNLEDNTKIQLADIKRDELNDFEEINFQIIFFRKGNYYLLNPVNRTWNVKPSRFYKENSFTENDFFHEKAFIYEITKEQINLANHISDDDIEKAKKEKERKEPKKVYQSSKKGKDEEIEEIDLHIQELTDDYSNLTNAEILDIQMSRFTTALEGAILSGTRRIIFIHGVGNGRLKHEILKTLNRKYPKLRYQDASFKEYGYGATLVILK
ncbi:MAG: DUF2027 domain-containing protein [Bacteroidota bacterium]|nr:DUF2027 domain-containing protein [Bacteroidota bacterium]